MEISVIIVTFNSEKFIIPCLKSIFDKTINLNYEIIIVDNNSEDNTVKIIKETYPSIKIVENNKNLGFSKANNIAIKLSSSKYVFLLNPDTLLLNNAIKIFFDFMEKEENTNISCCGGTVFNNDMTLQETFGNFSSISQIVFEFGLKSILKDFYNKNLSTGFQNYDLREREVQHIVGSGMFIRKNVFDKIGYFDEDFFLYYEETELCFRMRKNGFQLFYIPEPQILHYKGKSESLNINKQEIIEYSRYLFFKKCYGLFYSKIANILYTLKYILAYISTLNKKYLLLLKINIKILLKL